MKSELCAPVMMKLDSTLLNFNNFFFFLFLHGFGKQKLRYFKILNKGLENVSLDITNYILFGSCIGLHAIPGFFFQVERLPKSQTYCQVLELVMGKCFFDGSAYESDLSLHLSTNLLTK